MSDALLSGCGGGPRSGAALAARLAEPCHLRRATAVRCAALHRRVDQRPELLATGRSPRSSSASGDPRPVVIVIGAPSFSR
jgi:hypothetical protein